MFPRLEACALAVALLGFGLFVAMDPPILGGFVVAAGAELLILGRFIAPGDSPSVPEPTPRR